MDFQYRIPGTTEPEITVRRSTLGNISVHVDGKELKRRGRGLRYDIPLPDGTTTELEITGQWRGLKAKANGVETALEPPVSPIFVVLIFLPLALAVLGGLIGGVIGAITAAVNLVVSRRRIAGPLKLAAMLLVLAVGVGGYFVAAFAIAPVPKLATGDCLNAGLHEASENSQLEPARLRPVDCAIAHEDEVVGIVTSTATGTYPGMQALFDAASDGCLSAFASYVGVPFEISVLEMTLITPTDLTWIKGDRAIACVAYQPGGRQLTGTIRGSAR